MNQKDKVKVVLVQLGSPKSTSIKDVRAYLKEFLGDPRVVDINPLLWKIILHLFVLPFRPKKSAQAYSRIYQEEGFPLVTGTLDFAQKVQAQLPKYIELEAGFLLSEPRIGSILKKWTDENEISRAQELYVLPQFPQYSESTVASGFDSLAKSAHSLVNIPSTHFISQYHNSKAFINGSIRQIKQYLHEHPLTKDIIISFHGIPLRRVLVKKDIYYRQCFETFSLIQSKINFPDTHFHFTFQSRFGSEQWLGPATDSYAKKLAKAGVKSIGVYCASFVIDCLETTDEIGTELKEDLAVLDCDSHLVPCLNSEETWVKDYAQLIETHVSGSRAEKEAQYYSVNNEEILKEIPVQEQVSPPLSDKAKKSIKIVFWTLFLDLVGFSIIFPLFPALAKYYIEVNPDDFFLKAIFGVVQSLTVAGQSSMSPIVLFGGALGAIYSLLQFVAAPFWGGLSDRIGRKPVLLISVAGLLLSYVLWFFSGSFTILILARFIGGIMGGNISTATAVVADVTDEKNRSKGMAFVGIAFALGFILGPALGGIFASINLLDYFPESARWGVNPFSIPAFIAGALCFINLIFIAKSFKETLTKKQKSGTTRTANLLKIFQPLPQKGINLTNLSYFIFLTFFSGMEFTLTFLAVERLSFSPMDNAYMFIFIGFFIALTQGGYVRRKANSVGEGKMAIQGLIATIPGLLLIGYTQNTPLLYLGLFFLSIGSAMVIPTLTALVSLYSPKDVQGKSLGIFRSLGALGRVIGPIIASLLYWRFSSSVPYLVGTVMMIIPIYIIGKLPAVPKHHD